MSDASPAVRSPAKGNTVANRRPVNRQEDAAASLQRAFQCFPSETFRDGQRESLQAIHDAFVIRGRRFVVAELPTGIGKSHIAIAMARFYGSAHILTVQKILQSQYESTFGSMLFSMKGRSAYDCLRAPGRSCAIGPCRTTKNITDADCPYKTALFAAHESAITVHNFDSFYYQNKGRPYATRDLMVVDEAHNLEQRYLSFMSFTLSNRRDPLLVIPEYNSAHQYKLFVQEQRDVLTNVLIALESKDTLTSAELTMMEEANDLLTKLTIFLTKVDKSEYVVDYENKDAYVSVTFRPVFVGSYIVENLFPAGNKVLMLSATILDKNMFCKSVGLPPDEVEFIQMDSYFPAKNRPVIRKYVGSMSFKEIEESLPRCVEALREVLAKFPDKRGIVQTHSERIANYIKFKMSDESRLTFRKDFATTEGMLEAHRMKSNSFIVASGLREGLDLHGDLSRIQIIMKVPYPDLGDKRTKRKKEIDSSWYGVQTALSFVQMIGRSVRSKEDKAVTYIFDSSFEMFYNMNRRFIPHYVRESIR